MDTIYIDIYSIPLYYISFEKNLELETNLRNAGYKNINHFQAVDVRGKSIDELFRDRVIGIRAFSDIVKGRKEHIGITSKGAIGCSLSHLSLWKKCIENGYDYITIVEDDCNINRSLSKEELNEISMAISKENGIFISFKESMNGYFGTHFYIASIGSCKKLYEYMIPIEIQVDGYMSIFSQTGLINLTHKHIYTTNSRKSTTMGEEPLCIICHLPRKDSTYIYFLIFIIVIVITLILARKYSSNNIKTVNSY